MSSPLRPVTRGPEESESIRLLGGLYRYRAVGEDTGDAFSLFEVSGPSGFASPFHIHTNETEAFFVTGGKVTLFIADVERRLDPGSFALAPAGVVHTFRFESPDARLLLLITPGNAGHEALFREMGEPALGSSPPAAGAPNFGRLAELAARHSTTIVGPPPAPPAALPRDV